MYLQIICEDGVSRTYKLVDPLNLQRKPFKTGSVSSFLIPVDRKIGYPVEIIVWHDNGGEYPCWHLRGISVSDVDADWTQYFPCNDWLSVLKSNNGTKAHLYNENSTKYKQAQANEDKEINLDRKHFSLTYLNIFGICLLNYHLWISLFWSSPLSIFCKRQRLSCAFATILLQAFMLTMFYQELIPHSSSNTGDIICVKKTCINLGHLLLAVQSSVAGLILTSIFSILFEVVPHLNKRNSFNKKPSSKSVKNVDSTCLPSDYKVSVCGSETQELKKASIVNQYKTVLCEIENSVCSSTTGNDLRMNLDIDSDENRCTTNGDLETFDKFFVAKDNICTSFHVSSEANAISRTESSSEFENVFHPVKSSRNTTLDIKKTSYIPEIQHGLSIHMSHCLNNLPAIPHALVSDRNSNHRSASLLMVWLLLLCISFSLASFFVYFSWRWNSVTKLHFMITFFFGILIDFFILQLVRPLLEFASAVFKHLKVRLICCQSFAFQGPSGMILNFTGPESILNPQLSIITSLFLTQSPQIMKQLLLGKVIS